MMIRNDQKHEGQPSEPMQSDKNTTMLMTFNLDELIKIHRKMNKYQIQQPFFNKYTVGITIFIYFSAWICIENNILASQLYNQQDLLLAYFQDLLLVYFKDIGLAEQVRIEYVYRKLNFTLNGQKHGILAYVMVIYIPVEFKVENQQFQELMWSTFQPTYLQNIYESENKKEVVDTRNHFKKCLLIFQMVDSPLYDQQQRVTLIEGLCQMASSLKKKLSQNKHLHLCLEDLYYDEQLQLQILAMRLQNSAIAFILDHSEDYPYVDLQKLVYQVDINKEYLVQLKELQATNWEARMLMESICCNINLELNSGVKCICIRAGEWNSQQQGSIGLDYFGNACRVDTVQEMQLKKVQAILDVDCMQYLLLKAVRELKMRQVADKIQKVYQIEREYNRDCKINNLYFSVMFQNGQQISNASFSEAEFTKLNQYRQQSTLTSYLIPMKSYYSYISHNIYTFIKLFNSQLSHGSKMVNTNQEVLKKIKNKISRHRNLGKSQIKSFYYNYFHVCHNCKSLCHRTFMKTCRKKLKLATLNTPHPHPHPHTHTHANKYDEDSLADNGDDSLYTENNDRRKNVQKYGLECQKAYCFYCIKFQYGGKLLNQKGYCPFCMKICHCSTCLRQKSLQKLIDLYLKIGGDQTSIHSQVELIQSMQNTKSIKQHSSDDNQSESSSASDSGIEISDNTVQSIINKQKNKGYSVQKISQELHQQLELIKTTGKRELTKEKQIERQQSLFREKIKMISTHFNFDFFDREAFKQKEKKYIQRKVREQQQEIYRIERKIIRDRKVKKLFKSGKRHYRRRHEEQQCYQYNQQMSVTPEEESSFHLRQKKKFKKDLQFNYIF